VRNYSATEWVAALSRSGFWIERLSTRKVRMDFSVWITRTRAPDDRARAIRSLQLGGPQLVKDYFRIGADGGFDLDAITVVARNA
jgi:hypothetical protein